MIELLIAVLSGAAILLAIVGAMTIVVWAAFFNTKAANLTLGAIVLSIFLFLSWVVGTAFIS